MGATIREWLWTHAVSKLRLARMVEAAARERRRGGATSFATRLARLRSKLLGWRVPASKHRPRYRADVFDVGNVEDAKAIILTPETEATTSGDRWEVETPYLVKEIGRQLGIDANACVLDYGCGIGRLSKGLIDAFGCAVLGVDISPSMRQLAQQFVQSDRFAACTPKMLDAMIARGFRATHAIACWVIQHCEKPDVDLARIESALASRGGLYRVEPQCASDPLGSRLDLRQCLGCATARASVRDGRGRAAARVSDHARDSASGIHDDPAKKAVGQTRESSVHVSRCHG